MSQKKKGRECIPGSTNSKVKDIGNKQTVDLWSQNSDRKGLLLQTTISSQNSDQVRGASKDISKHGGAQKCYLLCSYVLRKLLQNAPHQNKGANQQQQQKRKTRDGGNRCPNMGIEDDSWDGGKRNCPAERTQEDNRMLPIHYLDGMIIWKAESRCAARTSKKEKKKAIISRWRNYTS